MKITLLVRCGSSSNSTWPIFHINPTLLPPHYIIISSPSIFIPPISILSENWGELTGKAMSRNSSEVPEYSVMKYSCSSSCKIFHGDFHEVKGTFIRFCTANRKTGIGLQWIFIMEFENNYADKKNMSEYTCLASLLDRVVPFMSTTVWYVYDFLSPLKSLNQLILESEASPM